MAGQTLNIADVCKCQALCYEHEQLAINTFRLQVVSIAGVGITTQDVANRLDADLSTAYRSFFLCNSANYLGFHVEVESGSNNLMFVSANANAGPGTRGLALPRQTAGVLSYYDGYRGRGHRGRLYLPFPGVTDDIAGGKPTTGGGSYVGGLGTFAQTILVGFNVVAPSGGSGILAWVLAHRAKFGPPPVPRTWTPVVSYVARTVWGTQRRRGSYGRPNIIL